MVVAAARFIRLFFLFVVHGVVVPSDVASLVEFLFEKIPFLLLLVGVRSVLHILASVLSFITEAISFKILWFLIKLVLPSDNRAFFIQSV